ncbi:MAG: paraquat-inducible membrane protein A [Gammaproteobacteria bacterium]|nr:MAG: paraquat-inducible membrane protein A [Gammaproteobacteria bacterium]
MSQLKTTPYSPGSAAERGLANCHYCQRLTPVDERHCPYCGSRLHLRNTNSIQSCLAWLVTSIVLYIPANIYPIMVTSTLGKPAENTIISGVLLFIEHGSYLVAAIIFIASVLIPIAKMLAIIWLCYCVSHRIDLEHRELTRLYRVTEFIGKWSMVDVFVVAILVALVQMGALMAIQPGIAAFAFSGVVVCTMISAHCFDPRLIWDLLERKNEHANG